MISQSTCRKCREIVTLRVTGKVRIVCDTPTRKSLDSPITAQKGTFSQLSSVLDLAVQSMRDPSETKPEREDNTNEYEHGTD